MDLQEELQVITGRRKRFLLLRIIDVGVEESRKLCGITKGTYNAWLHNEAFVGLHRRRAELSAEYKQEALRMLRKANQLQAVLLEEKIVNKLREEIDSGKYVLVKTNLGKEVYSKLINDLDQIPQIKTLSWEQRIINLNATRAIGGGNGEVIPEAVSFEESQHQESLLITDGKQRDSQTQEETQT